MLRRPPRTTRTDTLFPTRRSSDLNGGLRVRRAPSRGEGLAEDQHVAELGDVFLFLEQVEIPAAVGGIAIEHRADDPVVLDDPALVNAAARVAPHDILAPVARSEERPVGKECVSKCKYTCSPFH